MAADDLERKLGQALATVRPEVIAAYLFGSQARGTARANSDVDVAILMRDTPPSTLDGMGLDVGAHLELALGRPVDLVVLNRAPSDLVHRVLRDKRIVLDRDRSSRIRFEVKVRNEYFDLLPFLRRYRRQEATSR
jgi:predicted nucleotidyltransferase